MDPITLALLGAGALKAGAGIAQGVGQARAGKKLMLTEAEQRELDDLERRQRTGELGLGERERGRIEQQFLAEQAGAQRELEATALQQAAARGLSGGVSGREVFLQEQAQAGTERAMRQQQNEAVIEVDRSAAEAEKARINAMRQQQKTAESMRAQGIAQAVSGGLAGAGGAAETQALMMQQTEVAQLEAGAKVESDRELLRRRRKEKNAVTGNGLIPVDALDLPVAGGG